MRHTVRVTPVATKANVQTAAQPREDLLQLTFIIIKHQAIILPVIHDVIVETHCSSTTRLQFAALLTKPRHQYHHAAGNALPDLAKPAVLVTSAPLNLRQ